jgi:hypothetical protein
MIISIGNRVAKQQLAYARLNRKALLHEGL